MTRVFGAEDELGTRRQDPPSASTQVNSGINRISSSQFFHLPHHFVQSGEYAAIHPDIEVEDDAAKQFQHDGYHYDDCDDCDGNATNEPNPRVVLDVAWTNCWPPFDATIPIANAMKVMG